MTKVHRRPAGVTPVEWIEQSLVDDGECRIWTYATTRQGYGFTSTGRGGQDFVHRLIWEGANGPIPESRVVDHICYNRRCARLDHLRLVTRSENQQNRRGAQGNSATGVRGVHWDKARGRWYAAAKLGGRTHFAGRFATIEEAERAAINLRLSLHENPSTADLEAAGAML